MPGIAPAQALASNKIQALAGVASSAHRYLKSGETETVGLSARVGANLAGASAGAICLRITDPSLLSCLAPFVLICVACFFLLSRNLVAMKRRPLLGNAAFAAVAALPIGFHDGFFGPGTGSI